MRWIPILILLTSCLMPQAAKVEAEAEIDGKEIEFDLEII